MGRIIKKVKFRSDYAAFEVETAIVLSTVVLLAIPVWNVIVALLSRHGIALALNLYLINPQPKPLSALSSNGAFSLGQLAASVSMLNGEDSQYFIKEFNSSITGTLGSLGFPTKQSKTTIISALYYIRIDSTSGKIINDNTWSEKYYKLGAIDSLNSPVENQKCGSKIADDLKAFAQNKLSLLAPESYTKTIGTQLLSADESAGVKEYLPFRGIIFTTISVCSPSLWTNPVYHSSFVVPSKEVGVY